MEEPVLTMEGIDGLGVEDVVGALDLAPHPEGGFYRETFRDERQDATGRSASTAIYYCLGKGMTSAWHRVDAAEIWHFYAGAPLELSLSPSGTGEVRRIVGRGIAAGEHPQIVVPAGWWQSARSLGAWSLVGCTVAPGFVFETFELAPFGWRPNVAPTIRSDR